VRGSIARCIVALVLLLAARSGSAEIYWWVDENGNVQSTSDLAQVPPEHRPRNEPSREDRITIVPELQAPRPTRTRSEPASVEPATAPALKPASIGDGEKRIEGKAKHQWRAGYQALERHVAGFERRIERMEDEPRRYRTRTSWNLRLERVKRQLEQAEAARHAYEDRARRAGVPPGWLR
jgi:hypothetical protein